jgi:hypothetical protein
MSRSSSGPSPGSALRWACSAPSRPSTIAIAQPPGPDHRRGDCMPRYPAAIPLSSAAASASPLPCPHVHHRPPLRHLRLRAEGIPVHRVRRAVRGDAGAALQFMWLRSRGAAVREVPQAVREHRRAAVPDVRVRSARTGLHQVRAHVLTPLGHASESRRPHANDKGGRHTAALAKFRGCAMLSDDGGCR